MRSIDMRLLALGTLCCGFLGLAAAPANANQYVFGYTPGGTQTLDLVTTTGSVSLTAVATGWYNYTGFHLAANPNYLVGTFSGIDFNDFFVFDLSGVTGTITSAQLDVGDVQNGFDSSPISIWDLYDVSTPISTLIADQFDAAGIYGDLASGTLFGTQTVTAADDNSQIIIPLDADAVSALNGAVGGSFAIGGTLPQVNIPEPATIGLLGAGLVGLGVLRRRTEPCSTIATFQHRRADGPA